MTTRWLAQPTAFRPSHRRARFARAGVYAPSHFTAGKKKLLFGETDFVTTRPCNNATTQSRDDWFPMQSAWLRRVVIARPR